MGLNGKEYVIKHFNKDKILNNLDDEIQKLVKLAMKILLTGGAGYIGSTTANFFLDKGHEVFIIDNLSRGNILNIPEKAKFIKTSIQNKKSISTFKAREF